MTVVALVSGPAYVASGSQDSKPEVVSLPSKSTERSWLYQPFESAAREGVAVVAGGVLSTWKGFEIFVVPPSLVAEQVSIVSVVSFVNVTALHPVVERMIDSGSVTDQLTVTVVVYQPLRPSVPEITGVTTGGVGSPGTFGRPAAPGVRSSAMTVRRKMAACRRMPQPYLVTTNKLLPRGRFAYRAAEIRPYPGQTYQR